MEIEEEEFEIKKKTKTYVTSISHNVKNYIKLPE